MAAVAGCGLRHAPHRQHVVIEAADGGLLAADATGVRIWFGRADNDRTDLQELEIFTDVLPATLILVK